MDAIHPAPVEFAPEKIAIDPILRYFHYAHLPEPLQTVSSAFCNLAAFIVDALPRNAERTVALRKLLEAKDAGVRANVTDQQFVAKPAPTFFSRLLAERDDVSEKLGKLDDFILSEAFRSIDQDNRRLLQRQALQMRGYVDTLDARIKLLTDRTEAQDTAYFGAPDEEGIIDVRTTGGGSVETPVPFND